MNREGIQLSALINVLETLKTYPQLHVEGVMSHFYDADEPNSQGIQNQINLFKQMYYTIVEYGHTPKWRHIGNSAALLKMQDTFFNAYRPGLALYGYNPLSVQDSEFEKGEKLQAGLSLSSVIISLNVLSSGEGVSYGPQWENVQEQFLTATIPFGYYE